jgi:uncharacterized protein (DUF4415 family)
MTNVRTGRIVLVDGQVYERQPNGSLMPMADNTYDKRLDTMTASEAEAGASSDPDALPMTDEEWASGALDKPIKVPVGIKLDADVLQWFKSLGPRGYQSRINAVLRMYMETRKTRSR